MLNKKLFIQLGEIIQNFQAEDGKSILEKPKGSMANLKLDDQKMEFLQNLTYYMINKGYRDESIRDIFLGHSDNVMKIKKAAKKNKFYNFLVQKWLESEVKLIEEWIGISDLYEVLIQEDITKYLNKVKEAFISEGFNMMYEVTGIKIPRKVELDTGVDDSELIHFVEILEEHIKLRERISQIESALESKVYTYCAYLLTNELISDEEELKHKEFLLQTFTGLISKKDKN